jgi:methyltransferase (TIGR00027 family)
MLCLALARYVSLPFVNLCGFRSECDTLAAAAHSCLCPHTSPLPHLEPLTPASPCCQFLSGAEHATCSHKTTRDAARTGLATASQHNVVYFSSRTNFIDNKIKAWIAQGFEQVVIVAAGFDSRAYRIPLNGSFFELDMPAVIAEKIQKVADLGLNTTGTSVGYVPADLRVKTAEQALRATPGFDATKKTVYVVEGLIYYLHQDDVDKLFESLGT